MRHFRTRYSMFKHEPNPDWPSDCIYAVVDHQTGTEIERGFTFEEAQDKIDDLTNVSTKPDTPEDYREPCIADHTRAMARSGAFGGR
jgi:hypothetical protein